MNRDFRDLLFGLYRHLALFGDVQAPVIGVDDLIRNKRATGRPKDLLDADALERQRSG